MNRSVIIILLILAVFTSLALADRYFHVFEEGINTGEIRLVDGEDQATTSLSYEIEQVAAGLTVPWSIVFTGPDRMLVSERPGRIRVIEKGILRKTPLYTFQKVSSKAEEGLMGLALHPEYEKNRYLYACYAYETEGDLFDRVVRLTDRGDTLEDEKILIDRIPAAQYHAGCRIAFGPDGKLYITTGDATDKNLAQKINSLAGKILRLNDDGTIPSDNPFPNSPVWSYGHRNPQGLGWHPQTAELYSSEHGPSIFDGPAGGDEVNRVVKGGNYGWPLVSHERQKKGTISPVALFTPAEAPGSLLVYSGKTFLSWKGNLFFGALRGEGIVRLVLDEQNPDTIVRIEKLNDVRVGRIREVTEGPDGYIYFTTSNLDNRGTIRTGDDHIHRIRPARNAP